MSLQLVVRPMIMEINVFTGGQITGNECFLRRDVSKTLSQTPLKYSALCTSSSSIDFDTIKWGALRALVNTKGHR